MAVMRAVSIGLVAVAVAATAGCGKRSGDKGDQPGAATGAAQGAQDQARGTQAQGTQAQGNTPSAPLALKLSPTEGPASGGTRIEVRGLPAGTQVVDTHFGTEQGSVMGGNLVMAPAGKAGAVVDVTVRVTNGRSVTLPKAYRYQGGAKGAGSSAPATSAGSTSGN